MYYLLQEHVKNKGLLVTKKLRYKGWFFHPITATQRNPIFSHFFKQKNRSVWKSSHRSVIHSEAVTKHHGGSHPWQAVAGRQRRVKDYTRALSHLQHVPTPGWHGGERLPRLHLVWGEKQWMFLILKLINFTPSSLQADPGTLTEWQYRGMCTFTLRCFLKKSQK